MSEPSKILEILDSLADLATMAALDANQLPLRSNNRIKKAVLIDIGKILAEIEEAQAEVDRTT